ncbi:MAG: glucuronate isomerase [Lentisphaerae bacterium]|nr:glucuronate isomerase [Lentisphaerota bacterium]
MPDCPFIHDDVLLETPAARRLYHEYAEGLPIIDYHGHLPPAAIAQDRRFANLAEAWLHGDHYKWRAMRANGVDERYCTGDAPDREKFDQWAATVPYLVRNQLYIWTHLELARFFGIDDRLLGPATADAVWDTCNAALARPGYSARGLLRRSRVRVVCTTDDPADALEHHRAIAADDDFDIRVLPTWRPDKGMAVEDAGAFNTWVDALAAAAQTDIADFDGYRDALRKRHDAFAALGCRLSDHGLETAYAEDYTDTDITRIFRKIRDGGALSESEIRRFKSAMLIEFGVMDHEKGWTQQFHFNALRNTNTRMFQALGPDTGFDAVGDCDLARPLTRLLDALERRHSLPRTILYTLNPADYPVLVSAAGSFQDGSVPGKIQVGSAWWFQDQLDGIERQLEELSQTGLLSRFVGMLTDSRSFLSAPRHEYFRRILCNVLGGDMTRGRIPDDMPLVGRLVQDVCCHNAARYFGFSL